MLILFLENMIIYGILYDSSIHGRMWLKSFLIEDKDSFMLLSQHHGCWCPGSRHHRVISSYCIDLVIPEYSGFSTRRVQYIEIPGQRLQPLRLECLASEFWIVPNKFLRNLEKFIRNFPISRGHLGHLIEFLEDSIELLVAFCPRLPAQPCVETLQQTG